MKMRYFVIGLIVFFVGVGVCLYPLIQDKYTSYKQEKMVEQVRDEIYNQIMNNNAKGIIIPNNPPCCCITVTSLNLSLFNVIIIYHIM